MKERQKALLLLNSLESLNAGFWEGCCRKGIEPAQVWEEPSVLEKMKLSSSAMDRLRDNINSRWAEREYERCISSGITILTFEDEEYPSSLSSLNSAPILIYVKGDLGDLSGSVGIVGTRKCSEYARRVTSSLAGLISRRSSAAVVSGGALGVDTAAHRGALEAGGRTIAVLGTGLDVPYPGKNKPLFRQIEDRGALVSEYILGTSPNPWRFPRRNHIIAGIANKLVVSEAPLKSGAMITARCSLELGREIWAIPGRIGETLCEGSNRLIFDGALPLVSISEFVSLLEGAGQMELALDKEVPLPRQPFQELDEKVVKVLELLRRSGDRTVDNIAMEGKMSAAEVLTCLGDLTIRGLVYPSGPGRWTCSAR